MAGIHLILLRLKICKPVSRILYPAAAGWLSFICPGGYPQGSICLPCNAFLAEYGRATLDATIHGISAQKVYP